MKKIIATLGLAVIASGAGAQGFATPMESTFSVQTNATAIGGGIGNTTKSVTNAFYYDVLMAPSTVTTVDASLQDLLTSTWSDTGITGVNRVGLISGAIVGVNSESSIWTPGNYQSAIVVGWSASLGNTWSQVSLELAGASFDGDHWSGGGFDQSGLGFLGASTIALATAGPTPGTAAFLFAAASSAQVPVPISTGPELYVIVPEPTALVLAGLSAGVLIIRRRWK